MKQMLREKYQIARQKFPALEVFARRIKEKKLFNTTLKKIRGKRNIIRYNGAVLSNVVFDIKGNYNTIEIRQGAFLNSVMFYLRGDNHHIHIGPGCRFHKGGSIWFEDSGGSLQIGENSTFENIHLAVTEPGSKIEIGLDCMFAYDIEVRTGDSHSVLDAQSGERLNHAEDVFIGNHVWIAAHSIILRGAFISEDSIVGTGALVTGKFSQKGITIAGNPARMIREGITWSRKRI